MARKRINKTNKVKRVKKTHNTRKTQRLRRKTRRRRNKKGGISPKRMVVNAGDRLDHMLTGIERNFSRIGPGKIRFNRNSWLYYKDEIRFELSKGEPKKEKILELITKCIDYMKKDLTHVSGITVPTDDSPRPKEEESTLQKRIKNMGILEELVTEGDYEKAKAMFEQKK